MASYLAYLSVREHHIFNLPNGQNWKAVRKKRLAPKLQFDPTVPVDARGFEDCLQQRVGATRVQRLEVVEEGEPRRSFCESGY